VPRGTAGQRAERLHASEPDWREAALFSNSTVVANAAELAEISQAIMAVQKPYFVSDRPAPEIPEDARHVHVSSGWRHACPTDLTDLTDRTDVRRRDPTGPTGPARTDPTRG
jgi:hypothetical protein